MIDISQTMIVITASATDDVIIIVIHVEVITIIPWHDGNAESDSVRSSGNTCDPLPTVVRT